METGREGDDCGDHLKMGWPYPIKDLHLRGGILGLMKAMLRERDCPLSHRPYYYDQTHGLDHRN